MNIIKGPTIVSSIDDETKVSSLGEYLAKGAKKFMSEVALIDAESEEKLTYQELFNKSYTIALWLENLKCNPGDVVAIVGENCFEFCSIMLAAFHVGVTCTCINPLYSLDELRHAFGLSKPKVVFASNTPYQNVIKIVSEFSFIEKIIDIETKEYLSTCEELQKKYSKTEFKSKSKSTDSVAIFLYSSGSTGQSKGVKLTQKSYIYLLEFYKRNENLNFPEKKVASGILPMSHCYGLFTFFMTITQGHTTILFKRFSKSTILNYIQKYKINILYLVPSLVIVFLKNPSFFDYDLSSIEYIVCAGTTLKKETEQTIRLRLKSSKFNQFYGMTETTGASIVPSGNIKFETIGKLLPGMEAKILDLNDGTALGPFQKGELCLKGVLLLDGYCLAGGIEHSGVDEDGWLHSGDVAYYDDDFDFFIVDRIKELIKYKSYQVPPTEIETLLLKLEGIEDCGVIGIPDEEAGELPRAYVVKKKGYENITESDIQQFVAENVSPPKRLRGGVIFVDEIPKSATAKINRRELQKWANLRDISH